MGCVKRDLLLCESHGNIGNMVTEKKGRKEKREEGKERKKALFDIINLVITFDTAS